MTELLLVASIVFGIISFLLLVGASCTPRTSSDVIVAKVFGSALAICIAIIIWSSSAMSNYNPTPIVLERPIEELRNVPFYFNEKDKPVEITGDARFADPKTTVVLLKTFPGGWKYGLYVCEKNTVDFAKKAVIEKN